MQIAVVTDSASDLPPDAAAAAGIRVVPLTVSFGNQSFRAGDNLSTDAFWERMTAPDAPFPTTAAASPGLFQQAFDDAFADGADAVICVDVAESLSGTIKSARIAAGLAPEREIHVIDSQSASMGVGLLALMAVELAAQGLTAADVAVALEVRRDDIDLFVGLDTLAYLRKGGRLSGPQAAIGTLLSVKPIITVRDGAVEVADRPRTRSKARARVLDLLSARPLDRLAVLYTPPADHEGFRDELAARVPGGIDPAHVSVQPVGPSVGPHLGPGCLGAVVLYSRT
jgi:fatty acid kinase fatty acid binding subunit